MQSVGTGLSIACCVAVLAVYFVKPAWSIWAWLLCETLSPVIFLNDESYRIEHLVLWPLAALVIFARRRGQQAIEKPVALLMVLLFVQAIWVVVTTVAMIVFQECSNALPVHPASLLLEIRPLLIVWICSQLLHSEQDGIRWLNLFLVTSLPVAVLSIGQVLVLDPVLQLTDQCYVGRFRSAVGLEVAGEVGIMRAIGVFENVSYAGTYFALVLWTAVAAVMEKRLRPSRAKLAVACTAIPLSLVGGAATCSATFLGGAAVGAVTLAIVLRRKWTLAVISGSLAAGIAGAVWFDLVPPDLQYNMIEAPWEKIVSGRGMSERYGGTDGNVARVYEKAWERPFTGWGLMQTADVVNNDSLYVGTFYSGGLVSVLVLLSITVVIFVHTREHGVFGNVYRIWLSVLLACGIGCPSFALPRILSWVWVGATLLFVSAKSRSVRRRAIPLEQLGGKKYEPLVPNAVA